MKNNYCSSFIYKSVLFVYKFLSYMIFMPSCLKSAFFMKKRHGLGRESGMKSMPKGAVWIHAASVGEVQVAAVLIDFVMEECRTEKTRAPDFMLSINTSSGKRLAENLLKDFTNIRVFDNPLDNVYEVKAILKTARPQAYIVIEKEIWPLLLAELAGHNVPSFLVNARLTKKSARQPVKNNAFWKGTLSLFDRILVRFEEDRDNFLSLDIPPDKLAVTGNCKVDLMLRNRERLSRAGECSFVRLRPGALIVAGSLQKHEGGRICDAYSAVRKSERNAKLILAPRHVDKNFVFWERLAARYGKVSLLSDARTQEDPTWDILLVDTIGNLFELYGYADAVFIGGSLPRLNPLSRWLLKKRGGQNLMEPVLLGKPTAHGPNMWSFPETRELDDLGLAAEVRTAGELATIWLDALGRASTGLPEKAELYFQTAKGGTLRSWGIMEERFREKAILPGAERQKNRMKERGGGAYPYPSS